MRQLHNEIGYYLKTEMLTYLLNLISIIWNKGTTVIALVWQPLRFVYKFWKRLFLWDSFGCFYNKLVVSVFHTAARFM